MAPAALVIRSLSTLVSVNVYTFIYVCIYYMFIHIHIHWIYMAPAALVIRSLSTLVFAVALAALYTDIDIHIFTYTHISYTQMAALYIGLCRGAGGALLQGGD